MQEENDAKIKKEEEEKEKIKASQSANEKLEEEAKTPVTNAEV